MSKNDLNSYFKKAIDTIEKSIKYKFRNKKFIQNVVLHPSIKKNEEYNRLEFLGDRILGFIIADWILEVYQKEPRNKIVLRFIDLVNTDMLHKISKVIGLNNAIKNYTSNSKKTEANNCEALIGAIFLDGGMQSAKSFIKKYWKNYIDNVPVKDDRGFLQEFAQKQKFSVPVYSDVTNTTKLNVNNLKFTYQVEINELNLKTNGTGKRKKDAACMAANKMIILLKKLGYI